MGQWLPEFMTTSPADREKEALSAGKELEPSPATESGQN
jgi:hypothetical protein